MMIQVSTLLLLVLHAKLSKWGNSRGAKEFESSGQALRPPHMESRHTVPLDHAPLIAEALTRV